MLWSDFSHVDDLGETTFSQYHEPETTMGRLRFIALLVEATVDSELLLTVPLELRPLLRDQMA